MAIRDFYDQIIEMYSYIYYMQPPLMINQACWHEAKCQHVQHTGPTSVCALLFAMALRGQEDKLDRKDEDYYMVPIDTFLDYLKGNFKAAEVVESGKILKKDKHKNAGPHPASNSHNQNTQEFPGKRQV
jgi:hypothetical protein